MESGRAHHGFQARVDFAATGTAMAYRAISHRPTSIPGIGCGYQPRTMDIQANRLPAQYFHERYLPIYLRPNGWGMRFSAARRRYRFKHRQKRAPSSFESPVL
jgi:hypothetical protein